MSKSDQIRAFLMEYPKGTHTKFMETTGITVASSHFSLVRSRVRENNKLPDEGTQADAVRLFLKKNPDGTRSDFIAETGIKVAQSHFSVLRSKLKNQAIKKQAPKVQETVSGDERNKVLEDALALEQRENAYLRWLLEGERQGYLDRALEELTDGET